MKPYLLSSLAVLFFAATPAAIAQQPLISDSRIKTFVYNENEVYELSTHTGYQLNVEFGAREEVQTVALGDRVGWKVVANGRRLFIAPMEDNIHTNMTVITTKRTYQFDLNSGGARFVPSKALAYVIRFYYPGEDKGLGAWPATTADVTAATIPPPRPSNREGAAYNYDYTFTGPDQLAPLKVFDDGAATYFKLNMPPSSPSPRIFAVGSDGNEHPVEAVQANGELVKVGGIAPRFVVRYGDQFICIYNERT